MEHGTDSSHGAPPEVVILGDWRISHTEVYLGHSRFLSAVPDSNADAGPQYAPAVLQATLLLLATLMSVVTLATVASCWGWLRGGKGPKAKRKERTTVRSLEGLSLCAKSWGKYAFGNHRALRNLPDVQTFLCVTQLRYIDVLCTERCYVQLCVRASPCCTGVCITE